MPKVVLEDNDFTDGSIDILNLLVTAKMAASRSEARRAVEQGGVSVNNEKVTDIKMAYTKEDINKEDFIVKKGKKTFMKIEA